MCNRSDQLAVFFALGLSVFMLRPAFSQTDSTFLKRVNGINVGVSAVVQGIDAGLGIEVTSPLFLKNKLSLRIRGGVNWHEWYKVQVGNYATYPFLATSLVFNTLPTNRTRVYVEAGPFMLLPSEKFSDKKTVNGFTASTGVEFFSSFKTPLTMSYFLYDVY